MVKSGDSSDQSIFMETQKKASKVGFHQVKPRFGEGFEMAHTMSWNSSESRTRP